MDKNLSRCIDSVLKENSVDALYLYGSYVNGYYIRDSDIDLVASTSTNSRKKPITMPPNISVHLVDPSSLQKFEIGHPYIHLKMFPVYNQEKCVEISDKMKSELVRRELVKLRKAGVKEFDALGIINNYLLNCGIQRPWRIKPIKRIFESQESQRILKEEYQRILDLLEQKGMVEIKDGKFIISPDYVFNEEFENPGDDFLFKFINSYGGWHYLRNVRSIIDFKRERDKNLCEICSNHNNHDGGFLIENELGKLVINNDHRIAIGRKLLEAKSKYSFSIHEHKKTISKAEHNHITDFLKKFFKKEFDFSEGRDYMFHKSMYKVPDHWHIHVCQYPIIRAGRISPLDRINDKPINFLKGEFSNLFPNPYLEAK